MAKLFLTLAVMCVFGAVMVEGLDTNILQIFLAPLTICKAEVKASDVNVLELMQDTDNYSMKAKCLLACIMKKTKVMDNNGKFVKEAATTYVKTIGGGNIIVMKIAEKIIDICANIEVDKNPCEAAIQYGKCFKKELKARNFL
ncbi:hypothetical protein DOY81_000533 [Sarcophaga bullata]|nr:hypothetical protein DOY81_000533 [Sarcophaga bullata]